MLGYACIKRAHRFELKLIFLYNIFQMCGFSCYFHFDNYPGGNNCFRDLDIDESLEFINHRGPDGRGKYVSADRRCGKQIMPAKFTNLLTLYI